MPVSTVTMSPNNTPIPGELIRAASKTERRYITRQALGFYGALTMTGLYTLDLNAGGPDPFDTADPESYFLALKWCVAAHPILSTGIRDQDGEAPVFVRLSGGMDMRRHVRVVDPDYGDGDGDDETEVLRRVLVTTHDEPFEDVESVPPWRVVVLRLLRPGPSHEGDGDSISGKRARVYIIFAYAHSHGDGRSGLVFHKTFLEGLQRAHRVYDRGYHHNTPALAPLPPPLEKVCSLRVTWSYLLLTLFGGYFPAFVGRYFDFPTPWVTEGTWTGDVMRHDPGDFRTGAAILVVGKDRIDGVVKVCREKEARFTGLLNQLAVRALSGALSGHDTSEPGMSVDNFIGQIVVDLRGLVPAYSDDMMLNCVSAASESSPFFRQDEGSKPSLRDDTALWDAVRKTTLRLAKSADTLVDQPLGLLRYLDKFRPWFLEKLGKRRDSSYEISNAVVFDPSSKSAVDDDGGRWDIVRMVFSQPANVTSCPLSFSVVTTKGGEMVLTVNWQVGVLAVDDEDAFAKDVLRRIDGYLAEIA